MFFVLSKIVESVLVPSNLVLIFFALGIALLILKRRRLALVLWIASATIVVLGGVTPLGYAALSSLENRFSLPILTAPPTGFIVLGGAVDIHISSARDVIAINDGAERLSETAALANRYPQARIFLSGGAGHIDSSTSLTESALARDILVKLNIAPDRIEMEEESRSTSENAVESLNFLRPSSGETWLLITSANHMPRAVAAFRKVGFKVVPYPVDYRTHGERVLWKFPKSVSAGLEDLDLAVHEWIGLVAYRVGGKSNSIFP